MIKVLKPGLATSVQDLGREGYYHLGIPPSGALDQYALSAANYLVGNPPGAAGLECALVGPELEFQADALVAVCGAQMPALLDGREQRPDTAFAVRAGQVLRFSFPTAGARAYLAVAGVLMWPRCWVADRPTRLGPWVASRGASCWPVTCCRSVRPPAPAAPAQACRWHCARPWAAKWCCGWCRGCISPADRSCCAKLLHRSLDGRLRGGSHRLPLQRRQCLSFQPREQPFGAGSDPSNIVDSCYPIGSIQVPAGLEPIILHRDAVSGGGYAMIGTVISADLDLIGQMQPNQQARFLKVSLEQALEARRSYKKKLACLARLFS